MLEPLHDAAIVLHKIVTTKNVHERVQGDLVLAAVIFLYWDGATVT